MDKCGIGDDLHCEAATVPLQLCEQQSRERGVATNGPTNGRATKLNGARSSESSCFIARAEATLQSIAQNARDAMGARNQSLSGVR
jgi:hypothetical protein